VPCTWRDTLWAARRDLHRHLCITARVFPKGDPAATPVQVPVRLHKRFGRVGDILGTSFEYAEVSEVQPALIVMAEDHTPARGDVFILGPGEGYRVEVVDPTDDITIRLHVVRMSEDEVVGYP